MWAIPTVWGKGVNVRPLYGKSDILLCQIYKTIFVWDAGKAFQYVCGYIDALMLISDLSQLVSIFVTINNNCGYGHAMYDCWIL